VANPDFYTSVLWKRLLGPRILHIDVDAAAAAGGVGGAAKLQGNTKIRFAAACARNSSSTRTNGTVPSEKGGVADGSVGGGGVVLAFANPTADATVLNIAALAATAAPAGDSVQGLLTPRREWFLTSGGQSSSTSSSSSAAGTAAGAATAGEVGNDADDEEESDLESLLLSRVMLLNGVPLNHSSLKPGGMDGRLIMPPTSSSSPPHSSDISTSDAAADQLDGAGVAASGVDEAVGGHEAAAAGDGVVVPAWSYGFIQLMRVPCPDA